MKNKKTMENHMTIKQLKNACKDNDYIIVRHSDNSIMGVNCSVTKILNKQKHNDRQLTNYISYRPCSFHEYITYKAPFFKSKKR